MLETDSRTPALCALQASICPVPCSALTSRRWRSYDDAMESAAKLSPEHSVTRSLFSFWCRHGYKLLALAPLAYLVCVVVRYGIDVPFWDQWDLVPLLDKMYRGELAFSDLWAQHNGHRLLFPQLIMLGLARLTAWNILYELSVNIALALGVFAVLVHQIRTTERSLGVVGLHWAIPASSLIVFSISQYQNWLWGYQIAMPLTLLAVVGGIVLLSGPAFRWRRFAAAALLGIVATYSFASGVLFWPIGLGILLVVTRGRKERKASIATWLLVSLLTLGFYLWHYQRPASDSALSLMFDMPLTYVSYVLKYLGSICAQYYRSPLPGQQADGDLALVSGLLAMFALGWAGGMLMWPKIAGFRVLLPYLAMTVYSLGTAMMTGVGRVGMGGDEALECRYCTMVVPLWVSLVVFLLLLVLDGNPSADASSLPKRRYEESVYYKTFAARSLLVGTIALLGLSSLWATEGAAAMSDVQDYCRAKLLDLAAHPEAEIDYGSLVSQGPYAKGLVESYPALVRHRLSLFRNGS